MGKLNISQNFGGGQRPPPFCIRSRLGGLGSEAPPSLACVHECYYKWVDRTWKEQALKTMVRSSLKNREIIKNKILITTTLNPLRREHYFHFTKNFRAYRFILLSITATRQQNKSQKLIKCYKYWLLQIKVWLSFFFSCRVYLTQELITAIFKPNDLGVTNHLVFYSGLMKNIKHLF